MLLKFNELIRRINEVTEIRRQRAVDGMPASFVQVYALLPVLLHWNHPALPGWVDHAPDGISHYQPDFTALMPHLSPFLTDFPETAPENPAIFGLYSMGSTSSIGQTVQSDLDIWVCVDKNLPGEQRRLLQKKCQRIETWAKNKHVDVNLFILDEDRFFRTGSDKLDDENCGSTQHILLLEEFYRTATTLAGKPLLWYAVSFETGSCQETLRSYDQAITQMCEQGLVRRDEWVDFGPLSTLSRQEYFGASLWQIYKSIDSPYKSVLKVLLLEAYTWTYPATELLAAEMKMMLYENIEAYYHVDHYYIILERVTRYLTAIQDVERIELARRCFYFKMQEKLTQPHDESTSWRRKALKEVVNQWGWDKAYLAQLDSREKWRITQVREEYDLILRGIMKSYRNLISFGRRHNLNALISPQDTAILTRKLYAAYEQLPEKVMLLAPYAIKNLSESDLTFICVDEGGVNRSGWYVYHCAPTIDSIVGHQPIEYNRYLVKLVAWVYFNGLLTPKTKTYLRSTTRANPKKLTQLLQDVTQFFPRQIVPASKEALYNPSEIRHLAIILNLENDPTRYLDHKLAQLNPMEIDILNYGNKQWSLIGSIDLLYRNSWNEVRALHFEGNDCVIGALKACLEKMHKDSKVPDAVEIFNYSERLSEVMSLRFRELLRECADVRLSTIHGEGVKFKPLRLAGTTWGLSFEPLGVTIQKFNNIIDFYSKISNSKLRDHSDNAPQNEDLPSTVARSASQGIMQFFFEDTTRGFDLYILDENNQLEVFRNCNGSKESIIKEVNHSYAVKEAKTADNTNVGSFNFPQFYQVITLDNHQKQVVPFYSQHSQTISG